MTTRKLTELKRWEDIPRFRNEDEELEFWSSHCLPEELINSPDGKRDPNVPLAPVRAAPERVSLRLEPDTARRLRALAAKKGTPYTALMQSLVIERLYEEEKREGLVGR